MKKLAVIALALVLALSLVLVGCTSKPSVAPQDSEPAPRESSSPEVTQSDTQGTESFEPFVADNTVMGNTSGNLYTYGNAAANGDWIYYAANDNLYRMSLDGKTEEQLTSKRANYINVLGSFLFYAVHAGSGIYRVPITGGDVTQISDASVNYLTSAGEWLYYYDIDTSSIHRLSQDGETVEAIGEKPYKSFFIHEGKMYANYADSSSDINNVDCIDLDDLSTSLFLEAATLYCGDGSWLYGTADGDKIRISTNDEKRETLGMSGYRDLPFEGKIYSHGRSGELNGNTVGSLYVRNPKDKDGTLLQEGNCFNFNVVPGWIFYRNYDETDEKVYIWRLPLEGGAPTKIS